jgi:hypothetical protein
MDLKKLLKDLKDLDQHKNEIRFGHYKDSKKALTILIKELDYLTIFD